VLRETKWPLRAISRRCIRPTGGRERRVER
jgi:hypothetical protein